MGVITYTNVFLWRTARSYHVALCRINDSKMLSIISLYTVDFDLLILLNEFVNKALCSYTVYVRFPRDAWEDYTSRALVMHQSDSRFHGFSQTDHGTEGCS